MRSRLPAQCLALLLLALAHRLPSAAAAPTTAPGLFPRDERLARTVTVRASQVYLGELLNDLSQQTGVSLTVDDSVGPVSGRPLTVFVNGLPVHEVMTGLSTLLTHHSNRWEWHASGKGARRYILRSQRSPAEAAAAARMEILEKWKADVRLFHHVAGLPAGDRDQQARSRPDVFPREGVDWTRGSLFGELTSNQLDALLRGEEVKVDRRGLTIGGAAAYDNLIAQEQVPEVTIRDRSGTVTHVPQPNTSSLAFRVKWEPSNLGPVMWCQVKRGFGVGSTSFFGGDLWDRSWLATGEKGWQNLFAPEVQQWRRDALAAGRRGPICGLPEWIELAGKSYTFDVLADPVYPPYRRSFGSWIGSTPEQTIGMMVELGENDYMRQGRLHLLRQVSASVHPRGHLLPWSRIKALREAADRNGGYLDFNHLIQLAQLTPEQLLGLVEEFPDADPERLESWRPMLQFYLHLDRAAQSQVRRPEGLSIRDAGVVARSFLDQGPDPLHSRGLEFLKEHLTAATVSLRREMVKEGEQQSQQLVWEIRAPGTPGHRAVWRQQPRVPLPPSARQGALGKSG